jgi:transposase
MYSFFIGIDVSKSKLDVSYCLFDKVIYLGEFPNSTVGFTSIIMELKSKVNYELSHWFFCFENTGVYSKGLVSWLHSYDLAFREENPIQIHKSLGLKRGKDDRADSKAICRYAFEKRDTIQASVVSKPLIVSIKKLVLRRDLLIRQKTAIQKSYGAQKQVLDEHLLTLFESQTAQLVNLLEKQIAELEQEIKMCISNDNQLNNNNELAQSVIGIGPIISAFMIAYTNNFSSFKESRKFASYIGVAPFPNSSGEYRGKTKVSQLANKKIKSLFSNAAFSAIRHDPQIANYYAKKLSEGKPKAIIINAIKNKLIHRIYAVIKRGTPYVKFQYI